MKHITTTLGALGIAGVVIAAVMYVRRPSPTQAPPLGKGHRIQSEARAPNRVLTDDPVEIFSRAFWRRPAPGDRILNAERREWVDGEGVARWHWFIAVKPSAELRNYLLDDNAFGLLSAKEVETDANAPKWFRFELDGVKSLGTPTGLLRCHVTRDGDIYADGIGVRPKPGYPEPVKPAAEARAAGNRLPAQSPPDPRKP